MTSTPPIRRAAGFAPDLSLFASAPLPPTRKGGIAAPEPAEAWAAPAEKRRRAPAPSPKAPSREGWWGDAAWSHDAGFAPGREPRAGLVGEWDRGFLRLSPDVPPCPGPRSWPAVHSSIRAFLDTHAERAAELGWSTLELFGVHPAVGTVRVDCSGALMVCGGSQVASVERDVIRLANGLAARRRTMPAGQVIPVWEFGR